MLPLAKDQKGELQPTTTNGERIDQLLGGRIARSLTAPRHRHANGQTLHVTEGIGLTQSRGGDVVVLHPGDTVWCPAGEWHWHGAAPDRVMTHLAIWDGLADGQDGPETEWGELVTDAEYGQSSA
jgi:mannose-6-phosphate isomerase-like protein (cupin superfamily)